MPNYHFFASQFFMYRFLFTSGGIVSDRGMIGEPLPVWLSYLFPRFREAGVFEGMDATHQDPNHCLVNEYLAGQGIMVKYRVWIPLPAFCFSFHL